MQKANEKKNLRNILKFSYVVKKRSNQPLCRLNYLPHPYMLSVNIREYFIHCPLLRVSEVSSRKKTPQKNRHYNVNVRSSPAKIMPYAYVQAYLYIYMANSFHTNVFPFWKLKIKENTFGRAISIY